MSLGLGAFMWQLVGGWLMKASGPWRFLPWQVMGIFTAIYAGAMLLALPFIRAPPPGFAAPPTPAPKDLSLAARALFAVFPTSKPSNPDRPYTFLQAVVQLEFVLIAVGMFGMFLPGGACGASRCWCR